MAEAAYELSRFAPREEKPEKAPRVKVVKKTRGSAKKVFKILRTFFAVGFLVALVCGVLFTQTKVTELQSQISDMNQELVNQEAMYAYLNFELESKTTPRAIEQRASEMGLVPLNGNQITYVQVNEGDEIEVSEGPLAGLRNRLENSLKLLADHINPK